ncbi:MAG: hypothetical protein PHU23_16100, partial [Dehalococcoidales bacterium]|nr:hypothetical protein [Dehalococcoidales bacterium]
MSIPKEEYRKKQTSINEGRRLVITGVSVTLLMSAAIGICLFLDSSPKKATPVKSIFTDVIIPDYFVKYSDAIIAAGKKVSKNSWQMKSGALVTHNDIQGFFGIPLHQKIVPQQLRVPGDPRDYRKGIHQGIDFYATKYGDPIYAAAPGVVIRIDKN